MSNSVSEQLAIVNELLNEYKFDEAFQKVMDIEKNKNLTLEESLKTQVYKGSIYIRLGRYEIALKTVEELYEKSKEVNMPLFTLDAFFLKVTMMYSLQRKETIMYSLQPLEEYYRILEQYEKLFESVPRDDSLEFQEREACFLIWKGQGALFKGNLDLSLDYHNRSLALWELIDPHSRLIVLNLIALAWGYEIKGELNLALECDEKALSLIPIGEDHGLNMLILISLLGAGVYRSMGRIFYLKGDLNKALEYHTRDLEIQKTTIKNWNNSSYFDIIKVLVAQKNIKKARNYLQELKQFNEQHEIGMGTDVYHHSHALILKSSSRIRDLAEAEKILKELIEKNLDFPANSIKLVIDLCDLYFKEFQFTHQMDILDDIQPLIDNLLKTIIISYNSYPLLANLKLLQAKLALLQVSMVEARKFLTEAQQIADEHGLQLLAGEISKEHDHLLEELKLWESFKKEQTTIAERFKLASIDGVMERLQGRRAIEPLESSGQQPVSLLILAQGGVLLFTHPFTDEWKQDNDLFGSFLSAFSTFSDEFFSQGLDRAKFGEETILLQSVGSFSICYLFRGQTYFAKQKLEKFTETIQEETTIWKTLEKFEKSSQVAELKDLPKMEGLLNEIFLN